MYHTVNLPLSISPATFPATFPMPAPAGPPAIIALPATVDSNIFPMYIEYSLLPALLLSLNSKKVRKATFL